MTSPLSQPNVIDALPRPAVVRSDGLAGASPVAGILIATSNGTADDDCDRGDAEATLSLLQVDDEYDARQYHHRRLQNQQGIYRHYSLNGAMSPSNGGSPNRSAAGKAFAPSNHHGRTGRNSHHTADATDDGPSALELPDVGNPAPCGPEGPREDGHVHAGKGSSGGVADAEHWETTIGGTGVASHGGEVTGGRTSVNTGDDDDSARGDEVPWLLDQEELEAREKLQRALRDQQRFRQEELRDLQRVYVKAMRKTFRSLRGMPEPSFDTPTALYEEELDAMAAAAEAEAGGGTGLHGSDAGDQDGDDGCGARRDVRYVGTNASGHPWADSNASLDTTAQHADCTDEDSMVESAQQHFLTNMLGGGQAARYAAALPGGTHIHTTHGGGDSQQPRRGAGEVYGGTFSTGFVHKLRSRRESHTRDADSGRCGRSPSE